MEPSFFILGVCLFWAGCVIIGIIVGNDKKRLFEGIVATLLLGILGVIWIVSVKAKVICPECKSHIDADAKKCRHCGHDQES